MTESGISIIIHHQYITYITGWWWTISPEGMQNQKWNYRNICKTIYTVTYWLYMYMYKKQGVYGKSLLNMDGKISSFESHAISLFSPEELTMNKNQCVIYIYVIIIIIQLGIVKFFPIVN
jgi:hypothetical protein